MYAVPPDITLNDITWRDFFGEVVGRFQTARLHFYLSEFLKAIAQKYRESKRPVEFLLDLLKLNVGRLLSGERVWSFVGGVGGGVVMCVSVVSKFASEGIKWHITSLGGPGGSVRGCGLILHS